MTITDLARRALPLLLALGIAACNPLDPDNIRVDTDGGAPGCTPACGPVQLCLATSEGACGCFVRCDDSLCADTGGSCVFDPSAGVACYELDQAACTSPSVPPVTPSISSS